VKPRSSLASLRCPFGVIFDEGFTAAPAARTSPPQSGTAPRVGATANVPRGVTQDLLLLAHGFDSDLIEELVHAGLARSRREIIEAGGPPIEIVRITITDL
jgi:hypothetical protein